VTARLLDVRIRSARLTFAPTAAPLPMPARSADRPAAPGVTGIPGQETAMTSGAGRPWLVLAAVSSLQNDARNFEELKPPVVFSEGFCGLETSPAAMWRWMGDNLPRGKGPVPLKGLVHLLNTKKDTILTIAAIVPLRAKPTTIRFSFNGLPLDEFTMKKDRFEKTYKIPAARLGQEEYCELLLSIDSFQIPMELHKNSQDGRRLGLRLTKLPWGGNEGIGPGAELPNPPPAPVPAEPPEPSEQAEAPPRNTWPILLGIALVIFALVLALAVYQRLRARKANPGDRSQDQPVEIAATEAYLSFPCSSCGKLLKMKTELKGKLVKCPHCGQTARLARSDPK
jgi:DNA-directed RNA polymerase subunit RPC12/RpoP